MKRNLQGIILAGIVAGILGLSSCSNDERPLPEATAGFNIATLGPEVFVPVKFENVSLNADFYVWEYGDGSKDSSASIIHGSHIYDDPGSFTVKLRAYNQDGQFMETEKNISVGERFMTSFNVVAIGEQDFDGNKLFIDTLAGIDLMIAMGPLEDPSRLIDPPITFDSVGVSRFLPQGISLNEDYVLTDEDFFIALYRADSVVDDVIYRTLLDATFFNPLNETITFKTESGDGGIIIEPLAAFFGYQYILQFEID